MVASGGAGQAGRAAVQPAGSHMHYATAQREAAIEAAGKVNIDLHGAGG